MATLLIDDNEEMLLLFSSLIKQRSGGEIVCAKNGSQALSLIGERPIKLIISDTNMPEMCGIDLLMTLREQGISIPFVLLFSESKKYKNIRKEDLSKMGASEVISKTMFLDMVSEILKRYLDPEVS